MRSSKATSNVYTRIAWSSSLVIGYKAVIIGANNRTIAAESAQSRLNIASLTLLVELHLGVTLVVLEVALGLLGLVTGEGTDNGVLLALKTVAGTGRQQSNVRGRGRGRGRHLRDHRLTRVEMWAVTHPST